MPSAKRERQRAAREVRTAQIQSAQRRSKRIRWGGIAVVVVAAIVGISILNSHSKKSSTAAVVHRSRLCPATNGSSPRRTSFPKPPPTCINPSAHYQAVFTTDVGSFTVALNSKDAPRTVNNFVFLARYHFFDGTIFHRVIPGFVVQGGDPTGTGTGGPGYSFDGRYVGPGTVSRTGCAPPRVVTHPYKLGSLAMANSGSTCTDGSQFFVVSGSQGEALPNLYTLFGKVISGMPVVEKIAADGSPSGKPRVVHRILKVLIKKV
ncbi:MAG: peptidylprolyl isomerase [Acidimicrobiales bacterium]